MIILLSTSACSRKVVSNPSLQKAVEYNANHTVNNIGDEVETLQFHVDDEEYASLLNDSGDGIMGTIRISTIDLEYPFYHSSDTEVLKQGPVHLYGTSLPIGGVGTHAVIYGYLAIPEREIFLNLYTLEAGDTVELTVADQTLTYRVVDTVTCLPEEVKDHISIESDKDLLTLATETPYGINTHRYLVRCIRDDQ